MTDIKNVSVLGAGVLGSQIAYQAAYAGFNVISYDINDDALAAAKKRFDKLDGNYVRDLDDATEDKVKEARERLSQSSDLKDAVSDADLVIEAVPEKLDLKKSIWSDVAEAAPEKTIFTTNTSTLAPSDFREATGREEKFLALHFANQIWLNRTAEIMPTDATDEEIRKTVVQYAKDMGMVPVELKKEHPGYILNSLSVPLLEAAQRLWINDVADPAEIDLDWRMSTGSPVGPFEGMDIIGLRTVTNISSEKKEEDLRSFSERVKKEYLDKDKFGVESGEGFHRYDDEGNRIDD